MSPTDSPICAFLRVPRAHLAPRIYERNGSSTRNPCDCPVSHGNELSSVDTFPQLLTFILISGSGCRLFYAAVLSCRQCSRRNCTNDIIIQRRMQACNAHGFVDGSLLTAGTRPTFLTLYPKYAHRRYKERRQETAMK